MRGQFATSSNEGVIPFAWLEDAIERWKEWDEAGRILPCPPILAVDVGGGGGDGDETVFAPVFGHVIPEIRHYDSGDEMATAGRAVQYHTRFGGIIRVDAIGIGSGVVARLREVINVKNIQAFKGSNKSRGKDRSGELRFANARSEAYWHLRDLLNPQFNPDICLPPDPQLIGDLTAIHWKPVSDGKIIIEEKKDIRKRIGRSTNVGDAVAIAFWVASRTFNTLDLMPIGIERASHWTK